MNFDLGREIALKLLNPKIPIRDVARRLREVFDSHFKSQRLNFEQRSQFDLQFEQTLGLGKAQQSIEREAFHTSLFDYAQIFRVLEQKGYRSWFELGFGGGKGPLLANIIYPQWNIGGVEIDSDCCVALENLFLKRPELRCLVQKGDLKEFEFIEGFEIYYGYIPYGSVFEKVLESLAKTQGRLILTESYGDCLDRIDIDHRWERIENLSWRSVSKRHDPLIKAYRAKKGKAPNFISFDDFYLRSFSPSDLIQLNYLLDGDRQREWVVYDRNRNSFWIADFKETEIYPYQNQVMIQFKYPPRTLLFPMDTHHKLIGLRQVPNDALGYLRKRRRNNQAFTDSHPERIRKIYFYPKVIVELSDGKLVNISD